MTTLGETLMFPIQVMNITTSPHSFLPPHCKCSLHPKFGGNSETRSFAGFIITFLEV